jgi:subtilisin family serine protease
MRKWITPAEAAEAIRRGTGRGIRVAVLDSGVEVDHPALSRVNWVDDLAVVESGYRLAVAPGDGCDLFGHGTAVAGVLHATAPDVEIGSIRVLGSSIESRTSVVREGARIAIERGYHILNCSFGCSIPEHVLRYKDWIDDAYLRGTHVVAACNNQDIARQEWPAFFSSVISVSMAETQREGVIYYQPGSLVEFAAHGVDVDVPWKDGQRKRMSGSSFAAPKVAGLLACLLSEVPDLPPLEAKALLHRLAHPWNKQFRPDASDP